MLTSLIAASVLGQGYTVTVVSIPSSGGQLQGRVYAPNPLPSSPVPVIGVLPGGGAGLDSVEWGCIGLASSGYVAISVLPQQGGSVTSYATAIRSAITFAGTAANPHLAVSDLSRVGGAGWSLGARALTLVQEQDDRFDAIVAWDNLAAVETGDQGSPSGGFNPPTSAYRTPKIPALGMASDATGFNTDPEIKKTAFNWWSKNQVPAMQAVFANSNHFWWSGRSSPRQQAISNHYTISWFDLWLKEDDSATDRLIQKIVNGEARMTLLSTKYRSAAKFGDVQTDDLRSY